MKKALFFLSTMICSLIGSPIFSQQNETPDSLGLPGDNLNLYGVLDLFQKSETLEEFEKKLNSEESKINNLDLNGNNKIDYISVKDNMKGSAHAIVLQVAVNEKETQDVAVIEVEKDKNENVQVQIIGDELLYGKDYIIEPKDASSKDVAKKGGTANPGFNGAGKTTNVTNNYYTTNNSVNDYDGYGYGYYPVRSWSIISYLFFPRYIAYVSPWSWGYYPGYWSSWTPIFWHSYYSFNCYQRPYFYGNFCRTGFYRNNFAHDYYGHRRSTSATVNDRQTRGAYSNTYSRRDLASKEGRSPKANRVSSSTYQNTRLNREISQNRGAGKERIPSTGSREISRSTYQNTRVNRETANNAVAGRERTPSSGSREISRSTYQHTRVNSETAQRGVAGRERNPSGNRETANSNSQNNRTNRDRVNSQNRGVNERTASDGNNNRGNSVRENRVNSSRQNNSVRQNGNSVRQNGNSAPRSGSYSAPSRSSYSAPSHSGGGGGRSSGGGGGRGR